MLYHNLISTITTLICCLTLFQCIIAETLARGFNDDIKWLNMADGLRAAKESNKPAMVLIHKSWCGACKKLKPHFTTSMPIVDLSNNFAMINIQDDEEDKIDAGFSKLGKYIPRIVFLEPDGKIRSDLKNEGGNDQYPYFYSDPSQVIRGMKNALEKLGSGGQVRDGADL